jgi:hypothetical protein
MLDGRSSPAYKATVGPAEFPHPVRRPHAAIAPVCERIANESNGDSSRDRLLRRVVRAPCRRRIILIVRSAKLHDRRPRGCCGRRRSRVTSVGRPAGCRWQRIAHCRRGAGVLKSFWNCQGAGSGRCFGGPGVDIVIGVGFSGQRLASNHFTARHCGFVTAASYRHISSDRLVSRPDNDQRDESDAWSVVRDDSGRRTRPDEHRDGACPGRPGAFWYCTARHIRVVALSRCAAARRVNEHRLIAGMIVSEKSKC